MIRAGVLHNAVVGKELRTRMRSWRSVVIISLYMAALGIIAIAFLTEQAGPSTGQSSQVGIQLFGALSIFQLFLIIFVTPASTAAAISGERQRQTWDLLLVTRLSSFGIVLGKLFAGLAFCILLIFASLPLFSLVFLFGGVAPDDVAHTYIVFLATVLLLGVVSLFVSALTARVAVSMIVSNVLALMLSAGLSLMTLYFAIYNNQQQSQLTVSRGPVLTAPDTVTTPALTPLAQLDPIVAILSALPNGNGNTILGGIGVVRHAFGLPIHLPMWGAFSILVVLLSLFLLILTTLLVRYPPPWLSRGGG